MTERPAAKPDRADTPAAPAAAASVSAAVPAPRGPSSSPPASPPAAPRRRRWLRRTLYAAGALLALWGAAWLGGPPLLKWQGEKIASEQLGRAVHIGQVDFKPWSLELTVSDLRIDGAQPGDAPQLSIKRAYVDAALQSLLRLAPVIDALQIDAPALRLTHLGEGRYDIDDIRAHLAVRAAARPPAPADAEPARFALYNIALTGGQLHFDDRPAGQVHSVSDLRLALPFISNLPSQRQVKVRPQLAFSLDGSAFDSQAQALPFDASRETDAVLRLQKLDLAPWLPYLPPDLPLRPTAGVADAELRLRFDEASGRPALRTSGALTLHNLRAQDAQGRQALAFTRLHLPLLESRPLERDLHLGAVTLDAPQLQVQRQANGQLNLLPAPAQPATTEKIAATPYGTREDALKKPPSSAPGAAAASVASAASAASVSSAASAAASAASVPAAAASAAAALEWRIAVDSISLNGAAIHWHDDTTAAPGQAAASLHLHALNAQAQDLRWPMTQPLRFAGAALLSDTPGTLAPDTPAPAASAPDGAAPPASTPARTQAALPAPTPQAPASTAPGASTPAAAAPASAALAAAPADESADGAANESADDAAPRLPGWLPAPGTGAALVFRGLADTRSAQVQLRAQELPLALAAPYLAPHLAPRLDGTLNADMQLDWATAPANAQAATPTLRLQAGQVQLSQLRLTGEGVAAPPLAASTRTSSPANANALASTRASTAARQTARQAAARTAQARRGRHGTAASAPGKAHSAATPASAQVQAEAHASAPGPRDPALPQDRARRGPLAGIEQLTLSGLQADLPARRVSVARVGLQAPRLMALRDASGRWMAQDWLRPRQPDAPAATASAAAQPPDWQVQVAELALQGGALGWRDALPPRTVRADVTGLALTLRGFALGSGKPMPLELSARVGASGSAEPGRLAWRGSVGTAPLAVQGELDAERLPLHAFLPYAGDRLNVDVLRADASFKGSVQAAQTSAGLRLRASGNARMQELRTHDLPLPLQAAAQAAPHTAAQAAAAPAAAQASQAPLAPLAQPAATQRAGGLGEELLSFKLLQVDGLAVHLDPGQPARVDVQHTTLSDFFARLVLLPNGQFRLRDLVKSGDVALPADVQAAAPAASGPDPQAASARAATDAGLNTAATTTSGPAHATAAAASPAAAASAPATAATATATARAASPAADAGGSGMPVIHMGPTQLRNGHIVFSDYFIRPNYTADLTELNGSLGAFSTAAPGGAPQMADLQLSGRAEGSATLEISGKLNPLAKPLALDIRGKVRELDLPPLSPYSVKYAGHGIERGKLSVDVAYTVQPDGQLTASNKLVLNQLTFGEPVQGAPASLPVRLATALLADSNGVIDLDLPISGSLNDPQFSLGPVIFKAIVSLIGKAITAPFRLLASAFGGDGGQDMSHVPFAPGSATLDEKARQQLDAVAKALTDRPQLKLTVAGHASLAAEQEGWRRQRLLAMIAAEGRASASPAATASASATPAAADPAAGASAPPQASAAADPASAAALPQDLHASLLRRLYRRADLPGKPRNAIGMARDIEAAEMEKLLMQHIRVDEDAMRQLALQRGVTVKDYLAAKGVPSERLFLGASRLDSATAAQTAASAPAAAASAPAAAWQPHAELTLSAR